MSVGAINIAFNDYGKITFITGKNLDDNSDNGVGKTTISHALWYCLTGDAPDKVKLNQIPNRKSGSKSFEVECNFIVDSNSYNIKRSPKKLEFLVNGENLTKTNSSVNEDILKAIGVDKITLYQSLFVSVDGDVSFFDKKSADKVKYIESVLNLKIFEQLFDDAKKGFNDRKNKKEQAQTQIEYLKRDIQRNEAEYSSFASKQQEKYDNFQKEIDRLRSELRSITIPTFKRVDDFATKKAKLDASLKSSEQMLAVNKNNIERLRKEISALKSNLVCPTCKKPFDDQHSKEEKISELNDSIGVIEKDNQTIETQITKFKSQVVKANEYEMKLREEEQAISRRKNIENQLVSWEQHASEVLLEENPFGSLTDQKKNELDLKTAEYEIILAEFKEFDVLKYVYSPDGVKNLIIKKIIKLFNDILGNYLIKLNSPFKLTFDETFEETIIHDGFEVAYGTLSRGEKARIMLAIVFTFKELRRLQTGFVLNITFYDEIFDLGLCKNGMLRCMEILEGFEQSFVITHRSENIDIVKYDKIELVKKNSVTSLVNR